MLDFWCNLKMKDSKPLEINEKSFINIYKLLDFRGAPNV